MQEHWHIGLIVYQVILFFMYLVIISRNHVGWFLALIVRLTSMKLMSVTIEISKFQLTVKNSQTIQWPVYNYTNLKPNKMKNFCLILNQLWIIIYIFLISVLNIYFFKPCCSLKELPPSLHILHRNNFSSELLQNAYYKSKQIKCCRLSYLALIYQLLTVV